VGVAGERWVGELLDAVEQLGELAREAVGEVSPLDPGAVAGLAERGVPGQRLR
jgi:hypothetical protein